MIFNILIRSLEVTLKTVNYKLKTLILLTCLAVVAFACWFASKPNPSHGDGIESHDHTHVHGEGIDHGHEHPDLTGTQTHSHPHQHDRHRHETVEFVDHPGLTEIGHAHVASGDPIHFWGKVEMDGSGKFVLEFFESQGDQIKPASPVATEVTALVFNGSDLEERAQFEKDDDHFTASAPDDFLVLPTHVINIQNLVFGEQTLDAVIPITK